jgi:hypothetical protein
MSYIPLWVFVFDCGHMPFFLSAKKTAQFSKGWQGGGLKFIL